MARGAENAARRRRARCGPFVRECPALFRISQPNAARLAPSKSFGRSIEGAGVWDRVAGSFDRVFREPGTERSGVWIGVLGSLDRSRRPHLWLTLAEIAASAGRATFSDLP